MSVTGAFVHLFNASYKYLQTANDAKVLNNSIGYAAENPVGERKINSHGDLTAIGVITLFVPIVKAYNFVKTLFYTRPLEAIAVVNFTNDVVNSSMPADTSFGKIYNMYDNRKSLVEFLKSNE
ncbi:MAG: hypothetical protein ACNI25_12220 [Halarcobacter sp.]